MERSEAAHLSCMLKSSSMSSSSQLSSHNLSPPDFAAPGAVPARCARSVLESSQSDRIHYHQLISIWPVNRRYNGIYAPATSNSSNSSSSSKTPSVGCCSSSLCGSPTFAGLSTFDDEGAALFVLAIVILQCLQVRTKRERSGWVDEDGRGRGRSPKELDASVSAPALDVRRP